MAEPATVLLAEEPADDLSRLAEEVRNGLSRSPKELPSRYFYDAVGSDLFDAITALPEYYLTRAETEILARHANELIDRTKPEFMVELGAGSCTKTRILLDAALQSGELRGFIPFDISRDSLGRVNKDLVAAYPGLMVLPLVGDFVSQLEMIPRLGRQLLMFLGSTVGNFAPDDCRRFFKRVRSLLEPGDAFLVGFDLVKDEAELRAAYNDDQGVTARFNLNLLARLNRELQADFDLQAYRHVAIYNRRLRQIEMYLESRNSQVVTIPAAGVRAAFAPGERMRTEISRKFTRRQVASLFARAGMRMTGWYTDSRHRFAVGLATVTQR